MSSVGVDSYTLRMIDQITAPLRKIEAQMEKVTGLMDRMSELASKTFAAGGVVLGIGIAAKALSGIIDLLNTGVTLVGRFAMGFGQMVIKAAQFRQSSVPALDVLLGKGRGEGVFQSALRVGGMTAASEIDVVNQVKGLATAGYSGGSLNRANAALLDVQALGQGGETQLAYYLQKFKGGLSFERDDVRMAASASGIKERDLLTRAMGIAGATPTGNDAQLAKQLEGLKKAGKITGETLVEALLQEIRAKLSEGGKLGDFAKKMGSGTLSGLMSNLEDAPTRFLAQIKLEKLPGMVAFMDFLKRLLEFFNTGTEEGKQLQQVVTDLVNTLFGGFSKITSADLGRFFRAGLVVAKQLQETIGAAWVAVEKMMGGSWQEALGAGARFYLVEVGTLLGQGILQGFKAALTGDPVRDATGGIGRDEIAYQAQLRGVSMEDTQAVAKEALADFNESGGVAKVAKGGDADRATYEAAMERAKTKYVQETAAKIFGAGARAVQSFKVDNININGPMSPEQARETANSMVEELRRGAARVGAVVGLGGGADG